MIFYVLSTKTDLLILHQSSLNDLIKNDVNFSFVTIPIIKNKCCHKYYMKIVILFF